MLFTGFPVKGFYPGPYRLIRPLALGIGGIRIFFPRDASPGQRGSRPAGSCHGASGTLLNAGNVRSGLVIYGKVC